jgi:hypothetical protein
VSGEQGLGGKIELFGTRKGTIRSPVVDVIVDVEVSEEDVKKGD